MAAGDLDLNPALPRANRVAAGNLPAQLCGGWGCTQLPRSPESQGGGGPERQAGTCHKAGTGGAAALPTAGDGAGGSALPWGARSCTWVAGPQGGGGATLPPVPGATHRLLTTTAPRGLSPAPPPARRQPLQVLQSLALARLPAAGAPWPTGIGRTCRACRPGSEITGRPLRAWRCAPLVITPPSDPPGRRVAPPPHPHPFSSKLTEHPPGAGPGGALGTRGPAHSELRSRIRALR